MVAELVMAALTALLLMDNGDAFNVRNGRS